jgi:endonuclease/exonuclease/phosphatase family metal-dependent hydrolase
LRYDLSILNVDLAKLQFAMTKPLRRTAISRIDSSTLGRFAAGLLFALTSLNGSVLAGDIKVTTWNLEWFPDGSPNDAPRAEQQKRINNAAQVLRTLDSDIILLQEVRDLQAVKNLAEAIKPRTYSVAICSRFQEGGEIGKQQVAILAKVPAQAAWAEPWQSMQGVDPPRGFSFAWYKINGAELAVYCVHLKSNRGDSPANIRKREVAAQQMLDHISNVVAKKMPQARSFIIGGDLNTNVDEFAQETTLTSLEKNGFQNCMQGLARPMRVTHPASGGFPDTTFDYLLAKGATISKPQITRSNASDHLPVTCEITLGATGLQADAATALPSAPPMAPPIPQPAAAPSATPSEIIVTITQPTTITIPYGKTVLARGLRLPLSSRQGQTIHVRYMGGVYAIPASSTDLR